VSVSLIVALAALGVVVGFVAGLLGVGGGLTIVPLLALLFSHSGFPASHVVHMAIATAAATIVFTSLSSATAHHAHQAVVWSVFRALLPGVVAGSLIGPQIAAHMPSLLLALVFSAVAAVAAVRLLRGPRPTTRHRDLPGSGGLMLAGSVIGTLASMVGAGGAFVAVPFMTWCNVDIRKAVATSAALGLPIAAASTLGFIVAGWNQSDLPRWSLGYVYLPALAPIVVASMAVAPLGAAAAHRWPVAVMRRLFAFLLLGIATYMLWRTVHAGA